MDAQFATIAQAERFVQSDAAARLTPRLYRVWAIGWWFYTSGHFTLAASYYTLILKLSGRRVPGR